MTRDISVLNNNWSVCYSAFLLFPQIEQEEQQLSKVTKARPALVAKRPRPLVKRQTMPAIRAIPVAVEGMFKLVFLLNTEFKTERLNNYPNRRQWVTPKTMCNHNTISRNEKNRLTLVILQSFSFIMLYIHAGNGSVFKSLNLIEFIWLEGKATFCHTNPLKISEI